MSERSGSRAEARRIARYLRLLGRAVVALLALYRALVVRAKPAPKRRRR